MKIIKHISLALVIITTSCSFNPLFYHPDKKEVPATEKGLDVYIPYKKDKNVHGIFYQQENPIASIFILHGNAGSLAGWKSVAEALWDEGYQTFIFDYPGFGNSDGKARHNQVIASAQKAFDYFNGLEQVEGTKKIILGFSLGGNLALKIGPDNQSEVDAMVIEGCFSNYKEIGVDHTPKIFRFAPWLLVGNKFKGDETIRNWTKPFLVVHSTEDRVCPYWMGKEVFENAGSQQKELWTIDGPHIRGFSKYGEEYLMKIKKLVE